MRHAGYLIRGFIVVMVLGTYSSGSLATSHPTFGIKASTLQLETLKTPEIPLPEKDGKIKTLNKMGYMTPDVDHIVQDFIEFSATAKFPVLDGGAAYGVATILALKKGATVVANDMDVRHLLLIAKNPSLSEEEKTRLFLNEGSLPNGVDFPEHSLSAILLCRVMHFFTPQDSHQMFLKAKRWLVPNGRLYIVTMTPYHYTLAGFPGIYEKRWQAGEAWPGVITTMTTDYAPEHAGKIPDYLHVIEARPMIREATEQGFIVKKIELFGHHLHPKENGLGYIGAILINKE